MFNRRHDGFTLIEMVIAIVIISIGLAGVLLAFNTAVRSSADPLIHKQMLAIAEEMMEEILLKPYAVAGTAPINSPSSCGGATPPSRAAFDDVRDYSNYQTTGICDIDGGAVAGLASYGVTVTIINATLPPSGAPAVPALMVTVSVTNGSETLNLIGWRTDYAS